jgi:hypothetical protein
VSEYALTEVILLRLRALLARAHGDRAEFRNLVRRYGETAASYEFEGHVARAAALV